LDTFDTAVLEWCDVYFKRGFDPALVSALGGHQHKVKPLGLLWEVGHPDDHWMSWFRGVTAVVQHVVFRRRFPSRRFIGIALGGYHLIVHFAPDAVTSA
jgi:hypothetical protein